MDLQKFIDQLNDVTTKIIENKETPPTPLDNDSLWSQLIGISEIDFQSLDFIFTMLKVYSEFDKKFTAEVPPSLQKKLDTFKDLETEEDKVNYANSLFRIISFMKPTAAQLVMDHAASFAKEYMMTNVETALKLIQPFGQVMGDGFTDENLDEFLIFLREKLDEEDAPAYLFAMAPMAFELMEFREDAAAAFCDIMLKFLEGNDSQVLAALTFIIFSSERFMNDPEFMETNGKTVFDKLKSLFVSSNEIISKFANKAIRQLIICHSFYSPEYVDEVISMYPQLKDGQRRGFLKIISTFITPEEDSGCACGEEECQCEDNLSIIQPIVTFTTEKLKEDDLYTKGICLDIFGSLCSRNRLYVEDDIALALQEAEKLAGSEQYDTYEFVGFFCEQIICQFQDESTDIIKKIIPLLFAQIDNEKVGNLKHRIYLSSSIAEVIGQANICLDLIPNLQDFILKVTETKDEKLIALLCSVCHPVYKKFTNEFTVKLFNIIKPIIIETKNDEYLDEFIHLARGIIKNFSTINEAEALNLAEALMKSELKILRGKKVYQNLPPCAPAYEYLSQFIKTYPSKSSEFCKEMIEWITETPFDIIPQLLVPLTAGVKSGCLKADDASKLASTLKLYMSRLDDDDFNAVPSIAGILLALFNAFPESLNPVNEYFQHFTHFVEAATNSMEEEDFDDDIAQMIEAMPSITNFVFNVYANNDEVEVDDKLLQHLIDFLPFPPEVEEMNDIMFDLSQMLNDPERFEDILLPALRMITELLLLKKSELEEFEFEEETLDELKSCLKNCVKGNKKLQMQISKEFAKSRAKLNRFNALIR
ncbi:hypothetical protein GPJ56_003124 [Histomonas meleagridis]|uniref:uncharacterized protein n=1 Tax=Histomonas meleagridis TaxID=135588 RepID=UPI003559AACC|nr:hypothetical protein GPJ56_003124 [Histomonas meleagridis]KAH0800620.1 hypothetical protein GO595_006373 [Histomonas meleagridis]